MIKDLRDGLDEFLRKRIKSKADNDRTKRDDLTEAAIETLDDLLCEYQVIEEKGGSAAERLDAGRGRAAEGVTSILRSYSAVNREHDLELVDIDLAEALRLGRRNGSR